MNILFQLYIVLTFIFSVNNNNNLILIAYNCTYFIFNLVSYQFVTFSLTRVAGSLFYQNNIHNINIDSTIFIFFTKIEVYNPMPTMVIRIMLIKIKNLGIIESNHNSYYSNHEMSYLFRLLQLITPMLSILMSRSMLMF